MERQFYYIGIAFFGMINGLFNQTALLFALIHMQILAPALADDRVYRVGAALETLLRDQWGGPLLAQAPELEGGAA